MKKKTFYLIAILSGLHLMFDGLDGEFMNPTIFDVLKWGSFIVFAAAVLICFRKEKNNE